MSFESSALAGDAGVYGAGYLALKNIQFVIIQKKIMYKKRLLFWAACFGMLFFGICLITLGSVVPGLKEKYHLDEISSGTLFSILPFGILVGSLLFGPFCDKYGYKILLALSCFFMFAGFEGIAYAPSHSVIKSLYVFIWPWRRCC